MLLRLLLCCCCLGAFLPLFGCSTSRVELAVAGQPNVNPDYYGRPSPVVVKMYELRDDMAFRQAPFRVLFDDPLQALGSDLLAMNDLLFVPGKDETLAFVPNISTRFVGFVAGFRRMERAQWRVVQPVSFDEGKRIALELNDASIVVIPEDKAEDWDPKEAIRAFKGPEQSAEAGGGAQAAAGAAPASAQPGGASSGAGTPGTAGAAGSGEAQGAQKPYTTPGTNFVP